MQEENKFEKREQRINLTDADVIMTQIWTTRIQREWKKNETKHAQITLCPNGKSEQCNV